MIFIIRGEMLGYWVLRELQMIGQNGISTVLIFEVQRFGLLIPSLVLRCNGGSRSNSALF